MRHFPALVLVVALLVVVSCNQSTSPVVPSTPAEVVLAVAGSDSAPPGAAAPATVRVQGRELRVVGAITTSNPCQQLRAFNEPLTGGLSIVIEARTLETACVAVLGSFAYSYTVRLEPGTHRVRVEHRYVNTGWENAVVRDTVVNVP